VFGTLVALGPAAIAWLVAYYVIPIILVYLLLNLISSLFQRLIIAIRLERIVGMLLVLAHAALLLMTISAVQRVVAAGDFLGRNPVHRAVELWSARGFRTVPALVV
jgi:hypothetical protein